MSLNTSLKGRLRNTSLPKTNVLFPLFEAVINSIHSIDERVEKDNSFKVSDSYIKIKLLRSGQMTFDASKPNLIGFEIIDNGIGFTDNNYMSFRTLDSEYKLNKGCRGIGRLLWLKVFSKIEIDSYYKENIEFQNRSFDFNISKEIDNEKTKKNSNEKIETSIKMLNITNVYYDYFPKTIQAIAHNLLEHCLWYFIRKGGVPQITIEDGETILMDHEFDSYMLAASDSTTFQIKSNSFSITHVKLKVNSQNKHSVIYSASDRVVKEEPLVGKIPGLFGVLNDGEDNFCYKGFISSEYLTERVTPERHGFNISETVNGFFKDEDVSFEDIRNEVLAQILVYLEEYLKKNTEEGKKRVVDFVNQKAPRYRPILNRIKEEDQIVDPNITDKALEIKLHSHLTTIETELLSEGHDLMKPNNIENENDYSKRIEDYLSKASDLKKSDLANYVAHRKVILDLLGKAIEVQENGKYLKEEILHQLIMPMRKNSDDIFFNDSNLWLIDERLAFHNFLASDKTIKSMPITGANTTKEPDIISLNVYDNPLLVNDSQSLPLASITVIEIKRPMRNDAKPGEEKDPIEQALMYLERIRDGNVITKSGRQIPDSKDIPGFCYILCDLTQTVSKRCKILSLEITADKMGYFGYNPNYKAYIEVLSFDRLLNMAKERNKSFFDKLGLPTT